MDKKHCYNETYINRKSSSNLFSGSKAIFWTKVPEKFESPFVFFCANINHRNLKKSHEDIACQ